MANEFKVKNGLIVDGDYGANVKKSLSTPVVSAAHIYYQDVSGFTISNTSQSFFITLEDITPVDDITPVLDPPPLASISSLRMFVSKQRNVQYPISILDDFDCYWWDQITNRWADCTTNVTFSSTIPPGSMVLFVPPDNSAMTEPYRVTYSTPEGTRKLWDVNQILIAHSAKLTQKVNLAGDTMTGPLSAPTLISTESSISAVNVNYIDFNTDASAPIQEGRMVWDSDAGTVSIGMPNGSFVLEVGQQQVVRVRNTTGSPILKGQVVYIESAQPAIPRINLASALEFEEAHSVLGVVTQNINNNSNGYVLVHGILMGINTTGLPEGSPVYLSTISGQLTSAPPPKPFHRVRVGICLHENANGSLYVSINEGCDLEHLDDVNVIDRKHDDFITFNSALSSWTNTYNVSDFIPKSTFDVYTITPIGSVATVDPSNGPVQALTIDGNTTISSVFTPNSAQYHLVTLNIEYNSGNTVVWDNSILYGRSFPSSPSQNVLSLSGTNTVMFEYRWAESKPIAHLIDNPEGW